MNKWVVPAIIGIAALWLLWVFQAPIFELFSICWRSETLGQWGDTFGALNSLFAGLAAIGVVATLHLQRQALAAQKHDQARQRFESHFFQLLALLRELRSEIKYKPSAVELIGSDAIAYFSGLLKRESDEGSAEISSKDALAAVYRSKVHQTAEASLGAYFRTLFNILRLTSEENSLSIDDKEMYGNLVRAQLSTDDLCILGFNGFMKESGQLSAYIREFRLLKYMPASNIRSIFLLHYGDAALRGRASE
ncbi:putative phage abortive infection protein [Agrobacterium radiobacter]|uniref:putative phage abortive infection protein n=1 Tax=Agrobacterium radiobacter TaxID=362 RepID=UPI003CEC8251